MGTERAQQGEHRRGNGADRAVSLHVPEVQALRSADEPEQVGPVWSAGLPSEYGEVTITWAPDLSKFREKIAAAFGIPVDLLGERCSGHVWQYASAVENLWCCVLCGENRTDERMPR